MEEKSLRGSCCNPTWAVCRAKSFADDLVTERGIVNGRVAPCYDPLRLSLRLQICPIGSPEGDSISGWYYIREATAASGGAVASLGALLLCLYLGESSAGCATVCDMHSPHISKLCCVSQWQPASQPASQPLDICARPRFASVHDGARWLDPSLSAECMMAQRVAYRLLRTCIHI